MKKIITAMGNENLNSILRKENNIEISANDILYKEGIIEILEQNSNIDYIILNNLLLGELSINELINNIIKINKNIKIILILEKHDKQLENDLYNIGIYKIIFDNETLISEVIKTINKSDNNLIEKNINIKNSIIEKKEKNEKNEKNKIKNKFKKILNLTEQRNNNKIIKLIYYCYKILKYKKLGKHYPKIICITGPNGVGKSIVSVNLAKINIYSKNKILLVDFELNNNSISTILGAKKHPLNKSEDILENVIKINKKIDLIRGDFLLNSENKIDSLKINKIKNNYDLIIFDLSQLAFKEVIKNLINISDCNIFISDTNFLEISKSISLLNIFINDYKINKDRFIVLFNKYNSESIGLKLLNKIFMEFKILGYLKFNKNYNKLINKNKKNFSSERKIKREYLNINKKIYN